MKNIQLKTTHSLSDIYFGRGIINDAGDIIAKHVKGRTAVVVGDSNTLPLFGTAVGKSLEKAGFAGAMIEIPAGETSKNIDVVLDLYEQFHESGLTREGVIIALGGGVVGDLVGFAAATYLRGVDVVQIPTSLLAQVDSSIGGKTAIDMPFGKNTVGAFHQPKVVITDPGVIKSLKPKFYSDGMAEVIKYGCIKSAEMIQQLEGSFAMDDVIWECMKIKIDVVQNDEFDKGDRMLLNFGHTFGHAIEKCENYVGKSHGEAVAIGMCIAADVGAKLGITNVEVPEKLRELLKKFDLPIETNIPNGKLIEAMVADKKRDESGVNFVFIKEFGDSFYKSIKLEDIAEARK